MKTPRKMTKKEALAEFNDNRYSDMNFAEQYSAREFMAWVRDNNIIFIKEYKVNITELYVGQIDIEARNKREARKEAWKAMSELDMGSVMGESEGFKIKSIKETK